MSAKVIGLALAVCLVSAYVAYAQDAPPQPEPEQEEAGLDLYGFAMLDMGYDFGQIDPNWFDVVRPTKLPAFHNEFGQNGNLFTGVRQTRFGVKSLIPTKAGDLRTVFEFELFGVGNQAGETNFRLRQAYGELGQFLAGQTWSPFMDPDVFPNSIEYWGPNGMVFFRKGPGAIPQDLFALRSTMEDADPAGVRASSQGQLRAP